MPTDHFGAVPTHPPSTWHTEHEEPSGAQAVNALMATAWYRWALVKIYPYLVRVKGGYLGDGMCRCGGDGVMEPSAKKISHTSIFQVDHCGCTTGCRTIVVAVVEPSGI